MSVGANVRGWAETGEFNVELKYKELEAWLDDVHHRYFEEY